MKNICDCCKKQIIPEEKGEDYVLLVDLPYTYCSVKCMRRHKEHIAHKSVLEQFRGGDPESTTEK